MSAITLFPFDTWQSNTLDNATPANSNVLRVQALLGSATAFANSEPSSPAENSQYVVGTAWGGHASGNILIYRSGVWYEFTAYNGMPLKYINGNWYARESGSWVLKTLTTGS